MTAYPGPAPGYGAYPAPPPPPAPPNRRALAWVLAGVSVVCVIVLVAGGIWWWQSRKTDGDSGPVPGQLTKEFPTAPSVAWKLISAATGRGGLSAKQIFGLAGQDKTYMVANRATNEDGSVVAVFAGNGTYSDSPRLVLIDSATGNTRTVQGTFNTCSEQIVAGVIACTAGSDTDAQLVAVDVATGERRTVATLDSAGPMIGISRLGIFVAARDARGANNALIRYDLSGKVVYRKAYTPAQGFGSGDAWGLTATDALVAVQSGGATSHFRADNGDLLLTKAGYGRDPLPDGGLVTSTSTGTDLTSITSRDVVHTAPSGDSRTIPGDSVAVPRVVGRGMSAPFIVDGKLYLGDAPRWSSGVGQYAQVQVVADDVTVLTHDAKLRGVDTTSGRELWSTAFDGSRGVVTDGRHVMYLADGSVVAVDLHTGREQWRIPVPMDSTKGGVLAAAGGTLLFQSGDGIVGFAATGGAADAPGSRNTGAAKTGNGSGSDEYYTRCGSKPVFAPQKFRTESGGLVVTMKITATCPSGDALTSAGTSVTITDSTGVIASGTFDFAANSIGVPGPGSKGDGATVDLLFKEGQFFRTPDTLPAPSTYNGSSGAGGFNGAHSYLVDCIQPPGSGRARIPAPSNGPISTTGPGPQSGLNPQSGLSALRIQADSDKAFILGSLNNRWVAQLSSKRVGLVADGRTWDEKAILEEFLALRLRFADVRLLYSDEWPVFSYKGWWVSVAAATFPGPGEANGWCRSNGFDRDHCFAKFVSSTAGPDDSTRYW